WTIEAFAYWVREADVDGLRLDAAWGVHQRSPDFLAELSRALYAINPDLLLIAEASARDASLERSGFAAAYDWTEEPGHWAWGEALEGGPTSVPALRAALRGPAMRALRFLDNNDTGPRFRTRHGADEYSAARAMLLALPGVPAFFTGDEVGAEYSP